MTKKKATEIRQEELIEATLMLVEKHGLDNLNIAAIAAAVNLVPSAIYRHFKGKESIIEELINFVSKALQENIRYVMTAETQTQKRLKLLLSLHLQLVKTRRAIPKLLFSILGNEKNLIFKQKMLLVISLYIDKIRLIIAKGQETGEITPAIDPKSAALLFLGLIQPLVILSQNDNDLLEIYQETSWQIYWRGLSTKKSEG